MNRTEGASAGMRREGTLLDAFARAYAMVVEESASREAADLMLETIVVALGGDYGFFGFRRVDASGAPYLHTMAMSDIAWNEVTAAAYATHLSEGMKFTNLETLFGHVLVHEELLIAREARQHASASGVPDGHPSLDRFLGVPLTQRGRMEGMLGIANFDASLSDSALLSFAERASVLMYPLFEAMENDTVAQARRDGSARSRFHLLERVIGGFAHNLNNELVVIAELRDRLAQSETDGDRELATDVKCSVDTITDLISDLKTFARVSDPDDLLATLRSAARLVGLIGLAECELNLVQLPRGGEVAVPSEFLLSWLVEGAVLMTQALQGVWPLRIDCSVSRPVDDPAEPSLELLVCSVGHGDLKPVSLRTLVDEASAWGVEVAWEDRRGVRFGVPLQSRSALATRTELAD